MPSLTSTRLKAFRADTFQTRSAKRISTPAQALKFVQRRGFVYFWPIKDVVLPSLWAAVAGGRPVADAHDDPGHITWRWKDEALDKRQWYYAKVLRHKATIISLEAAPYFYALSENYGAPEQDHLPAYEEGRLTLAAKLVYEALLKEGRLNTIDLRKAARLTSKTSDSEFNRALEALQADFKILPVGVAEAGAWKYAFIYDISARYLPELPERARTIGEAEARRKLLELYFESVGSAQLRDVVRLFGWRADVASRTVGQLVQHGLLRDEIQLGSQKGTCIALAELVQG